MSSRPDPYAPATDEDDHVPAAAPVNPGAWDTRSRTLVDATESPGASGPEPLADDAARGGAPAVVWPEARHTDVPALDADGIPLAEPPTGPLRSVPGPAAAGPPGAPEERPSARGRAERSRTDDASSLHADDVPLAEPPTGPLPRPGPPAEASPAGAQRGRRTRFRGAGRQPEARRGTAVADAPGDRSAGPPARRRARATPRSAPPPAPPDPETRLPGPDPRPPVPGARTPRTTWTAAGDADRAPAERGPRAQRRGGAGAAQPATTGSADPVRELMHRHRLLCERAVDPLEIAAGLEAHGITDRTAARYRHRDVFSLAEELYVRVPRAETAADAAPDVPDGPRKAGVLRTAGRGASHLLPGALCAGTLAGLPYVPPVPLYARPAVGALGALAVLAAVGLSLRGVPRTRTAGLWACWLLGYVLYGDWLLAQLLSDEGPAERLLPALGCLCVPLAMSLGVAPAAWCAHLFAARARRRLASSRSLGDFAARVRPLLLLTVTLFAAALLAVQAAAHLLVEGTAPAYATQAATAALGVLLFVALLLSAHGFPRAASAGLASACLMVAAVLGAVLAARLPGAGRLAQPVETAVTAWGPTAVPIAACALAALPLLGYALRVLTGASAHQPRAAHPNHPPRQAR